jgi:hypothetical protein
MMIFLSWFCFEIYVKSIRQIGGIYKRESENLGTFSKKFAFFPLQNTDGGSIMVPVRHRKQILRKT